MPLPQAITQQDKLLTIVTNEAAASRACCIPAPLTKDRFDAPTGTVLVSSISCVIHA